MHLLCAFLNLIRTSWSTPTTTPVFGSLEISLLCDASWEACFAPRTRQKEKGRKNCSERCRRILTQEHKLFSGTDSGSLKWTSSGYPCLTYVISFLLSSLPSASFTRTTSEIPQSPSWHSHGRRNTMAFQRAVGHSLGILVPEGA